MRKKIVAWVPELLGVEIYIDEVRHGARYKREPDEEMED